MAAEVAMGVRRICRRPRSRTHAILKLMRLNFLSVIDAIYVPYKGAAAVNDVLSGKQGMFIFGTIPSATQFVRAGRLQGQPKFKASCWFGLLGSADMSREIANQLHP